MSPITRILRSIRMGKPGQLFSTRQFLELGSRGAIDQALYCLVKCGEIIRVTRGVFIKKGSKLPSVLALARFKAASFGKRIFTHGSEAIQTVGLPREENQNPIFVCTGRSSSFRFGNIVIRFVGTSPRKLLGSNSLFGQVVRAFWHLGKGQCTSEFIAESYPLWSKSIPQLKSSAPMLPAWMNNLFYWGRTANRAKHKPGEWTLFIDWRKIFPEFTELYDRLDGIN